MSGSLTLNQAQTVTFSPQVQLPAAGVWLRLTMRDATGATVFGPKTYNVSGTSPESATLSPGTFTYCLEAGGFTKTGTASISFTVAWLGLSRSTVFHTSFEEDGIIDVRSRTGQRVWAGSFSVPAPHISGSYRLTWWQRPQSSGSSWVFNEQQVTISSATQPDIIIGQTGQVIDEVRLHPAGAEMSTATPDDGTGITTSTDIRQLATRYEADAFGRLSLVRDDRRNILRQLQYKFKTP